VARSAFVVGGTGQIGRAVARTLLTDGWAVTLGHRGRRPPPADLLAPGVKLATLDRDMPGALAAALGPGADAVIDTVAYGAGHADQLLGLQTSIGALVVISSASVYRDAAGRTLDEARVSGFPELPVPIPETQATVRPGPATYSTRKMALERRLLNRARCPVTVLRPCAVHGPGSQHPREWWFVKRMLDGRRRIPLAHGGSSRFHTSSAANLAELVRVAVAKPGTRILNAADPEALSVAEIGALIAARLGHACEFVTVPDAGQVPGIGTTPWSVPQPFVVDTRAALALGYAPVTTYGDAVGATCAWLVETARNEDWQSRFPDLALYPWDLFDYAAEDRFLAGLSRARDPC
jgi:nucleoside-diphosphate-sugar epimerase